MGSSPHLRYRFLGRGSLKLSLLHPYSEEFNRVEFSGPFEAPFPVSWARDPQRGLYLGVTLESDVLLSRDGRSWEKVAQSSAVIGSVFCDQFCRLGHCDEWGRGTWACKEDRKRIAENLRVRLAALAYWGGQFFGVIAPIDNYPLSPVLIASSRDGVRWQF